MELFQELVFTISFSLIVSLLIAKLFSVASSHDDGNSTVSLRADEKIEKEWVVCDSEKEEKEKAFYFEDHVEVSEDIDFSQIEADLGSGDVIDEPKSVGEVDACQVFDEIPERTEIRNHDYNSVKSDGGNVVDPDLGSDTENGSLIQNDCVNRNELQQDSSAIDVGKVKLGEKVEIFDDDWQGIETTELEKTFGAAVAFMGSKSSLDRVNLIDNEVKIELYGLHKVAIEGSCFEPQPMALKVSARANWNSWKRLENLGREDAMEQYIALLSQNIPDWKGNHASSVTDKQ